jgi:hypothetical protein
MAYAAFHFHIGHLAGFVHYELHEYPAFHAGRFFLRRIRYGALHVTHHLPLPAGEFRLHPQCRHLPNGIRRLPENRCRKRVAPHR